MLVIEGGKAWYEYTAAVACTASIFWPIGTLIAGPTCIGSFVAAAAA